MDPPPLFSGNQTLAIDDIFSDCFFTPSGEIAFVDESNKPNATVSDETPNQPQNGNASGFGQRIGFVTGNNSNFSQPATTTETTKKAKVVKKRPLKQVSTMSGTKELTEAQKVYRRERNREHAKRSRIRKKFLLESLQTNAENLRVENEKLKGALKDNLGGEFIFGGGVRVTTATTTNSVFINRLPTLLTQNNKPTLPSQQLI